MSGQDPIASSSSNPPESLKAQVSVQMEKISKSEIPPFNRTSLYTRITNATEASTEGGVDPSTSQARLVYEVAVQEEKYLKEGRRLQALESNFIERTRAGHDHNQPWTEAGLQDHQVLVQEKFSKTIFQATSIGAIGYNRLAACYKPVPVVDAISLIKQGQEHFPRLATSISTAAQFDLKSLCQKICHRGPIPASLAVQSQFIFYESLVHDTLKRDSTLFIDTVAIWCESGNKFLKILGSYHVLKTFACNERKELEDGMAVFNVTSVTLFCKSLEGVFLWYASKAKEIFLATGRVQRIAQAIHAQQIAQGEGYYLSDTLLLMADRATHDLGELLEAIQESSPKPPGVLPTLLQHEFELCVEKSKKSLDEAVVNSDIHTVLERALGMVKVMGWPGHRAL